MMNLYRRLRDDESGFLISSEMVIIGTVGVLGMVVGLEAVSSAVIQELNDLSNAFGSISQSFNYRSIAKIGHARVSGAGFNDRGDACDCTTIVQTDVGGNVGGSSTSSQLIMAPSVVRGQAFQPNVQFVQPNVQFAQPSVQVIQPNVVTPLSVQETILAAPCPDQLGEIIEERIIRRRVNSTSDFSNTVIIPQVETFVPQSKPALKFEKIETKPKKN